MRPFIVVELLESEHQFFAEDNQEGIKFGPGAHVLGLTIFEFLFSKPDREIVHDACPSTGHHGCVELTVALSPSPERTPAMKERFKDFRLPRRQYFESPFHG